MFKTYHNVCVWKELQHCSFMYKTYPAFRCSALSWLVFLCAFDKNNLMQIASTINVVHIKFCFVLVHGFGCYYIAGSGKKLESLCRNPCGKSWCKTVISFLMLSSIIRACHQQSKRGSLAVTTNNNTSPQSATSSPGHFLWSHNKFLFCYGLHTVTVTHLSVSFTSDFKRLFTTHSECLPQAGNSCFK